MKQTLAAGLITTILLLLIASTPSLAQPPYQGTIWIDPDIITADDPSAFESLTYVGRGNHVVYDRRVPGWITINAYLFDVVWDDGIQSQAQINPEFGSVDAAAIEAEKYARAIGKIPTCLRVDVDEIWINKGVQPYGGGNRSILIHTGQTAIYEQRGVLDETLVHEGSHTSLDAAHAYASGWIEAQNSDPAFISTYARDNSTREDIAESFLLWMAVRYRSEAISQQDYNLITQAIPNRLNYFDDMECDLYPFVSSAPAEHTVPTLNQWALMMLSLLLLNLIRIEHKKRRAL
jgi:hypothetical protein